MGDGSIRIDRAAMAKVYVLNRLALAGLQLPNIKDKAIYPRRADLPKENDI